MSTNAVCTFHGSTIASAAHTSRQRGPSPTSRARRYTGIAALANRTALTRCTARKALGAESVPNNGDTSSGYTCA